MNIGASGFNTHGLCDESLLQLEDRIKQQLPQNRRDDFPDSLSLWVQNGREKFFSMPVQYICEWNDTRSYLSFLSKGFLWITNCNIVTHYHPNDKFIFMTHFSGHGNYCAVSIPVFTVFIVSEKGRTSFILACVILVLLVDHNEDDARLRIGSPESFCCEYWRQHRRILDNVWTLQKCKYKEREKIFGLVTFF